jgi:superoxide dismutase, Cu-Zn family
MRFRILFVIAGLLWFSATVQMAAAAPNSAHADIVNAQGTKIGSAEITDTGHGVKIVVNVSQLSPGEHGIHIHTVGKCEPPAFTSAGGHFNPTSTHHGSQSKLGPHPHLGDLLNLLVDKKGNANQTFVAVGVTLGDGADSLFHEGGTSLVIHAGEDDFMSDPSGNSGDRIACGVIEK